MENVNLSDPNNSPYPSWVYDETYSRWNPPYNHPDDGNCYFWVEETQEWIEVPFAN
jgi:hypothetical protein